MVGDLGAVSDLTWTVFRQLPRSFTPQRAHMSERLALVEVKEHHFGRLSRDNIDGRLVADRSPIARLQCMFVERDVASKYLEPCMAT